MKSLPDEAYKLRLDEADMVRVMQHEWYFDPHTGYTRRKVDGMPMHVFLMGEAPPGFIWDHVNRDRQDNRQSNLRLATHSQSGANRNVGSTGTSRYRGVYRHYRLPRWVAQIKVQGKVKYLGLYDSQEDAARAYDAAAQVYFGEFAKLNFPQ